LRRIRDIKNVKKLSKYFLCISPSIGVLFNIILCQWKPGLAQTQVSALISVFTALPHFLSLDLAEGSRWILYCNRSSADTFLPDLSTPILYFIGVKRKDSEFCFDNLQYWNWFKIGEGVPL